jgi:hypothetical protein
MVELLVSYTWEDIDISFGVINDIHLNGLK